MVYETLSCRAVSASASPNDTSHVDYSSQLEGKFFELKGPISCETGQLSLTKRYVIGCGTVR